MFHVGTKFVVVVRIVFIPHLLCLKIFPLFESIEKKKIQQETNLFLLVLSRLKLFLIVLFFP